MYYTVYHDFVIPRDSREPIVRQPSRDKLMVISTAPRSITEKRSMNSHLRSDGLGFSSIWKRVFNCHSLSLSLSISRLLFKIFGSQFVEYFPLIVVWASLWKSLSQTVDNVPWISNHSSFFADKYSVKMWKKTVDRLYSSFMIELYVHDNRLPKN